MVETETEIIVRSRIPDDTSGLLLDLVPVQRRRAGKVASPVALTHETPALTVIVPTRNEAGNVVPLLRRVESGLAGTPIEVVFVDDSTDDTPAVVEAARETFPFVRLHHRPAAERAGGLSGAVVAGLRQARAPYAVIMDGDLQHPPEIAAVLLEKAMTSDADIVIGSRYRGGGSASGLANGLRRLVSRTTNLLSRLAFPHRLAGVTDVMSGLFLVRTNAVDLDALRPSGYKILLELLLRSERPRVAEVPYTFEARHAGESNASTAEGMRFLRQIFWLRVPRPLRFAVVGGSGLVPNIVGTWALHKLGMHYIYAAVLATQVANVWNFFGCELLVWEARPGSRPKRFISFMVINAFDLVLRLPLLAVFVSIWAIGVGTATFLTLAVAVLLRYLVVDRLIYSSAWRGRFRRGERPGQHVVPFPALGAAEN